MGATRDDFIKYPRTPHLFGSKGTDDDKHLGRKESEAFIADPSLIVEEKIDGTNVGTDSALYTVTAGDVGGMATCTVTATNARGSTTAPASNPVVIA